jgi:hypothetical protein
MPMMPFNGVRSSWETLLMKRSFCSSSRFSSSMSFCKVQKNPKEHAVVWLLLKQPFCLRSAASALE